MDRTRGVSSHGGVGGGEGGGEGGVCAVDAIKLVGFSCGFSCLIVGYIAVLWSLVGYALI
jgi:hypothetical protein